MLGADLYHRYPVVAIMMDWGRPDFLASLAVTVAYFCVVYLASYFEILAM
jgi:hypothetical protein